MPYIIPKQPTQKPVLKSKSPVMYFVNPQKTEFYSAKYNIVLYHTTKCAMTTLKNFLHCQRVPLEQIPANAKVLCVVRNPVSRFISGFLTLRKIKLMKIYSVRPVSPEFRNLFTTGPLIKAFEATLNEVEKRGPFDTHLQAQTDYLGPSKTVQNEFAGKRNPEKVTYWVPIEQLSEFCKTTFGAVPPRKNESDKKLETQLKMYVKNHQLEDRILNMYKEDAKRYFDIVKK